MIGLPLPNGFIDLAKIDFSCPYCGKVYSDSDNLIHAMDNGLLNTKINNEIAEQIKKDTGTIREIAKKYGIGKTQVGYIKQGKRWQK